MVGKSIIYIKDKLNTMSLFLILVVIVLSVFLIKDCSHEIGGGGNINLDKIVKVDSVNKKITAIYSDNELKDLKQENKQLYDSLKKYKKKLDLVILAKYENKGEIKRIDVDTTRDITRKLETYTYKNNQKDSLEYELNIGAYEEPKWYSLKYKIKDNILVTNRHDGNRNQLDIKTDNGLVTDVTVIHPKKKVSVFDKVAIGPSVGFAYGINSKKVEPYIGVSVTYNLFNKTKK